jgi:hypothetical protein
MLNDANTSLGLTNAHLRDSEPQAHLLPPLAYLDPSLPLVLAGNPSN